MENQEESEMMQDFGSIARAVMGSGMQLAEHAQRRAQMRLAEANANAERERNIAQLVHRDLSSPRFWNTAGSEAIADRMIVASELAGRHEAASQAFMAGADRIRNQFGINVEDLNRDHPTAATDRHRALRDALDDYLAGQRANAEPPPMGQEPWFAQPQGTFRDYDYNNGLERDVEISKQEALRLLDRMPADTVSYGGRDTISRVPSWYGHDDEVDRAIAEKFPHLVPKGAKLPPETTTNGEAAEAQQDEAAHLEQAERAGGEEHLDRANTDTAEAKEASTPSPAAASPEDADKLPLDRHSAASERVIAVWKQKGGKDADFPLPPSTQNPQTAMKHRKRVMAAAAPVRTQGQELSR